MKLQPHYLDFLQSYSCTDPGQLEVNLEGQVRVMFYVGQEVSMCEVANASKFFLYRLFHLASQASFREELVCQAPKYYITQNQLDI